MLGLMQDWPLTVDKIIDHARAWHGEREVVTRSVAGPIVRTTYAAIHERARRLSNALIGLGVSPGDRVGTLAWNTARHLEAWYGIMGMGAVCHTLNPRLFHEQLCYIINHAEDSVILADTTFLPTLLQYRDSLPSVRHIVALCDEAQAAAYPGVLCFETLLAEASPDCEWGGFDERTAAGLCYTSGTTGSPKGVLYSHRSNFLHTYASLTADVFGLSALDTVLPIVPMFHANAWGIAFSAPAVGAKLVMPGQKLDGASLHELMESEGVTFSAGVPTVCQLLLNHLRQTGARISTLKHILVGGAAAPESLIRGFRDEYGVQILHAWGMTEISPMGTVGAPTAKIASLGAEAQLQYALKQGRPPLGIDLRIADEDGAELPRDGKAIGRLEVRGGWTVDTYFRSDSGSAVDADGFFDTGDIATLDDQGFIQITDRAKDVVKSGGEWISSVQIETIAVGHPKAALCAVLAAAHPHWDERPILLIKLQPDQQAEKQEFLDFLEGKIAHWWMPDDVLFVDDIPLGATGKIDKKLIRERMKTYVLPALRSTGPADADP